MKCSVCNFENPENARFCASCGSTLPVAAPQATPPTTPRPTTPPVTQRPATPPTTPRPATPPTTPRPATPPVTPQPTTPPTYRFVKPNVNKAVNSPKVKGTKKKEKAPINVFDLLRSFIYFILAALSAAFIFFEPAVRVKSAFNKEVFGDLSFFTVIMNLITGGDRYNPTVISIIMGVAALLLVFSSALFWLITLIAKLIKKSYSESRTMALIFTVLNSIVIAALVPVASRFSGVMNQACALEARILADDVASITSVWGIVFAVLCIVLIIVEKIFASKEKQNTKKD